MPTVSAETPPLEPAKHKSEPCTNTPENRGLQEILTHFTAFKALIKLRSISSGFLYFYVCAFPSDRTACILHFNSLFSPSSLFTALLEFCRVFFCKLLTLDREANVLLSLPPGWSSGMTDISAAKDFPHHGFPLKIAADDCCLPSVWGSCTDGAVPAELFRLPFLPNTHRQGCLSWNNTVLFQFSLVDILQWSITD